MANSQLKKITINGATYEVSDWFGVCTTTAATQTKSVSITGFDNNSLNTGVRVVIYFANAQTYDGTPNLNVSNTGALRVYYNNNAFAGKNAWKAGEVVTFTYYGGWYMDRRDGEANQNAFSNIKVGSATIAADSATDTLELIAGSNITLTPDATNDTVTIAASGGGSGSSDVPFVTVDSASTSTAFTAQLSGVTALSDGLYFYLYNNTVNSAATCTLNLNSLGAKPIYTSIGTQVSTSFRVGDIVPVVYNSTYVSGGCWIILDAPVAIRGTGASSVSIYNSSEPNTASGLGAFAGGAQSSATGKCSFAYGTYSSTLGNTEATGTISFAYGIGAKSTASGGIAMGQGVTASGALAFAQGNRSQASGDRSFAVGEQTHASSNYQAAMGKFNVADANSTYAFILGNGTADNARSNAMTIDWTGNEVLAGGLTVNATSGLTIGSTSVNETQLTSIKSQTTFIPSVSNAGVISWSNDGGRQNPTSVDLVAAVIAALPVYNGTVV